MRRKAHSKKLVGFYTFSTTGQRETLPEQSKVERERSQVFYACIDRILTELNARFTQNSKLLACMSSLDPQSEDFLSAEKIGTLAKLYPTLDINHLLVEVEASTAKSYISSLQKPIHNLLDLRFELSKMPNAFGNLIRVADLVLTLPVTSVENERTFSCMKRVKTYIRTRCGDERLSDLLVLAILQEEVKRVDVEKVINIFSNMRQRRYPLF